MESCFATVYCVCLISCLSSVLWPSPCLCRVFQTHRWDKQEAREGVTAWEDKMVHITASPPRLACIYFPCNFHTPQSKDTFCSQLLLILQVPSSGKPSLITSGASSLSFHPPVEPCLFPSCFVSDSMCFSFTHRIFLAHNGKRAYQGYNNHYCWRIKIGIELIGWTFYIQRRLLCCISPLCFVMIWQC